MITGRIGRDSRPINIFHLQRSKAIDAFGIRQTLNERCITCFVLYIIIKIIIVVVVVVGRKLIVVHVTETIEIIFFQFAVMAVATSRRQEGRGCP